MAHELASLIWLAVLDNLEENEHTFCLLKRLAQEGDVSAPLTFRILAMLSSFVPYLFLVLDDQVEQYKLLF